MEVIEVRNPKKETLKELVLILLVSLVAILFSILFIDKWAVGKEESYAATITIVTCLLAPFLLSKHFNKFISLTAVSLAIISLYQLIGITPIPQLYILMAILFLASAFGFGNDERGILKKLKKSGFHRRTDSMLGISGGTLLASIVLIYFTNFYIIGIVTVMISLWNCYFTLILLVNAKITSHNKRLTLPTYNLTSMIFYTAIILAIALNSLTRVLILIQL